MCYEFLALISAKSPTQENREPEKFFVYTINEHYGGMQFDKYHVEQMGTPVKWTNISAALLQYSFYMYILM